MAKTGANKQRSYKGDYHQDGKRAEEICLAFIQRSPSVVGLEDTRQLRVLRNADVDCVIHLYDGRCHIAEFKSDRHLGKSGNVLFEILRINHTCRSDKACILGWSARSPAKFLLYYAPAVQSIYMCRMAELRAAFQEYTRTARKDTQVSWVNTDNIKSTVNVLIPWEHCADCFHIYDVADIVQAMT